MKFITHIKQFIKYRQSIIVNVRNITVTPNELLKGRNAVIVGGGRIGLAIALASAEAGANVVILGKNMEKPKDKQIHLFACNVVDEQAISNNLRSILPLFERPEIDILVNCAGISGDSSAGKFFNITPQDFDEVMNSNCRAMFFWCQVIARHMIDHQVKGHILNISSSMGQVNNAAPDSISKWGIKGLTKGLAKILAPKGITVNGIAPGLTNTGMFGSSRMDFGESTDLSKALSEEIAHLAVFLLSNLASNIIGHMVTCDVNETLTYFADKGQAMTGLHLGGESL